MKMDYFGSLIILAKGYGVLKQGVQKTSYSGVLEPDLSFENKKEIMVKTWEGKDKTRDAVREKTYVAIFMYLEQCMDRIGWNFLKLIEKQEFVTPIGDIVEEHIIEQIMAEVERCHQVISKVLKELDAEYIKIAEKRSAADVFVRLTTGVDLFTERIDLVREERELVNRIRNAIGYLNKTIICDYDGLRRDVVVAS